jgi:hypothetical protein
MLQKEKNKFKIPLSQFGSPGIKSPLYKEAT